MCLKMARMSAASGAEEASTSANMRGLVDFAAAFASAVAFANPHIFSNPSVRPEMMLPASYYADWLFL